jgi:hypothetical protein
VRGTGIAGAAMRPRSTAAPGKAMMEVHQMPAGEWAVTDDAGTVIADGFTSNAAAWRYVDRQTCQPVSKREDTADWVFWNTSFPHR